MRFSEAYGITVTDDDDWFDTHLSIDTALFVDPALVLRAGGQWVAGHAEILQHFVRCYELIAEGGCPSSLTSKGALRLLKFPEPAEFCLGYTAASTRGAGGGEKAARIMRETISVAVAAGLQQPEHIKEIVSWPRESAPTPSAMQYATSCEADSSSTHKGCVAALMCR